MSISRKYGRTYHYDFSPGTTSDDRINHQWKDDISKLDKIIHTEKLDGENNCLNEFGIFARSHAAPTRHPWSNHLKSKYDMIKNDLKENNLEIFGENVYAIHSIEYLNLEHHFYIFGVRCLDKWLSWDEVKWYAEFFEYPLVPEIKVEEEIIIDDIKPFVEKTTSKSSFLTSIDVHTKEPCYMEGIVTRNYNDFAVSDFKENVFKWVRKNHVKTDTHWTRNWERAKLKWEIESIKNVK